MFQFTHFLTFHYPVVVPYWPTTMMIMKVMVIVVNSLKISDNCIFHIAGWTSHEKGAAMKKGVEHVVSLCEDWSNFRSSLSLIRSRQERGVIRNWWNWRNRCCRVDLHRSCIDATYWQWREKKSQELKHAWFVKHFPSVTARRTVSSIHCGVHLLVGFACSSFFLWLSFPHSLYEFY